MKIDICCRLVEMISDNDDTVKDMAVKHLAELLRSSDTESSGCSRSAELLVGLIGHWRGSQMEIENALTEIARFDESAGRSERSREIIDALIQKMTDEIGNSNFVSCLHRTGLKNQLME